jgi:hypothetical protein
MPKELGGLGIMDHERFARALRLRWLWFKWKQVDRPWTGLDISCGKAGKDLFDTSTVVTVGKGDKVGFWNSNWINGQAPKHLAPSLFQKSKSKKTQ